MLKKIISIIGKGSFILARRKTIERHLRRYGLKTHRELLGFSKRLLLKNRELIRILGKIPPEVLSEVCEEKYEVIKKDIEYVRERIDNI